MLLRKVFYIVILLSVYSCGMTFVIKKENNTEENNNKIASHKGIKRSKIPVSTSEYIDLYKSFAIDNMNNYHIPASITLAQGILESSGGKSNLAIDANNHFGIKCGPSWNDMSYYKDDDKKNDCFRVYDDVSKSFRDHSKILMYSRYKKLFDLDIKDYKSWAYGLKDCGYATNPKYPELLIGIIERYNLFSYDDEYMYKKNVDSLIVSLNPEDLVEEKNEQSEYNDKNSLSENNISEDTNVRKTISNFITSKEKRKIHQVEKGDTLYSISKKYDIDVNILKDINGLKNNVLSIGQKIVIP